MDHAKRAGSYDRHIGSRIRLARTAHEISQEELARKLGISFQQVQKYELGSNRISASRLFVVAGILQQPITYFFEGMDQPLDQQHPADSSPVRRKRRERPRKQVIQVLERLLAEETAE